MEAVSGGHPPQIWAVTTVVMLTVQVVPAVYLALS